jgi:hypothetical protein
MKWYNIIKNIIKCAKELEEAKETLEKSKERYELAREDVYARYSSTRAEVMNTVNHYTNDPKFIQNLIKEINKYQIQSGLQKDEPEPQ